MVRVVRVVRALVHELIKTLIPLIPRMFHHFYGKHSWDKSVSCFLSLSPQLLIFIHTDFTDFTDFVYIVLSCLSHPLSLLPPLSPWRGAGGEAFSSSPLGEGLGVRHLMLNNVYLSVCFVKYLVQLIENI